MPTLFASVDLFTGPPLVVGLLVWILWRLERIDSKLAAQRLDLMDAQLKILKLEKHHGATK